MRIVFIIFKWLVFILLLLWKFRSFRWLTKQLKKLDPGEEFSDTFHTLSNFLLFALGVNLVLIFVAGVYRRKQNLRPGRLDNVLAGLNNIHALLISGAVLATVLSLFGIDFQKLFTGLSIVAAAIAIITRDFIANILSGIALSFSQEFSIGDYIRFGEHKGKVIDITLSKTALLNDEDDVIFIPNNHFFLHETINHTKKGQRTVNIEFELNLNAIETVEELEEDLINSLQEFHEFIEENTFKLRVEEIKKDSLFLKFQYVLKRTDRSVEREIKKKTVRRVVNFIRREG